jgi:hypothetical protein
MSENETSDVYAHLVEHWASVAVHSKKGNEGLKQSHITMKKLVECKLDYHKKVQKILTVCIYMCVYMCVYLFVHATIV